MGCLTRIGCVTVLLVGGVAGYWLYGDRLPSVLGRAARGAADKVTDVAARSSERLDSSEGARIAAEESARRQSERAQRDQALGWVTVSTAASDGAASGALASLRKKGGPAYVSLSAAEMAGVMAPLLRQLPPSANGIQLALNRDLLLLRADVQLRDFAGEGAFGTVIGAALDGHDTLFLAGPLEPVKPVKPGLAQFRVRELRIKGIEVPTRVIPSLVGALRRRARYRVAMDSALAPDGLPVPLPSTVSDVRVVNGKLTFYRAVDAARGGAPTSTRRTP